MTLFVRLFLILLLSALLPVFATGVWFLRSTARAEDNARQMHGQLVQLCAGIVEESLGRMNRSLAFVQRLELERVAVDQRFEREILAAALYPAARQ